VKDNMHSIIEKYSQNVLSKIPQQQIFTTTDIVGVLNIIAQTFGLLANTCQVFKQPGQAAIYTCRNPNIIQKFVLRNLIRKACKDRQEFLQYREAIMQGIISFGQTVTVEDIQKIVESANDN
jgi:hypothetical protein